MPDLYATILSSDAFRIYGLVGVALHLGAYAALQLGIIKSANYSYSAINAVGSGLVLTSLYFEMNIASMIGNTIWLTLSVIGLMRLYLLARGLQMTYEDQAFLRTKFPALESHSAKRLLDLCVWSDAPRGQVLVREGAPVQRLVYLSEGAAEVFAEDKKVGEIIPGTLIGEFTVLDGSPATATVVTSDASRILQIEADGLRRLARTVPDIAITLHETMMRDARAKLVIANARAHELAEGFRGETSEQALDEGAALLGADAGVGRRRRWT